MLIRHIKGIAAALSIAIMILVAGAMDASGQSRRESRRIRQEQNRQTQIRGTQRQVENRINNANYITGYQQGLLAGEYDRRKKKYNQSNVYRGTGSYPTSGDPTAADYIYRQGYLDGYSDGFYGRRRF